MENVDITVVISENASINLKAIKAKQETENALRRERSDAIINAQLERYSALHKKWKAEASSKCHEKELSKDAFFLEMTTSKALDCSKDQNDSKAAQVIAINQARTQKRTEEYLSSEYLHHPQTRMEVFFKNAPTMCLSDNNSVAESCDKDSESFPSGSTSAINEIFRLEDDKVYARLQANDIVENSAQADPNDQRADVFERMWILVSEDNPLWVDCCSTFMKIRKEANDSHRQIAACKNCATVFVPFFPEDHHMHEM